MAKRPAGLKAPSSPRAAARRAAGTAKGLATRNYKGGGGGGGG